MMYPEKTFCVCMIGSGEGTCNQRIQRVYLFAWKLGDDAAVSVKAKTRVTIDLGMHPKHAGDPCAYALTSAAAVHGSIGLDVVLYT